MRTIFPQRSAGELPKARANFKDVFDSHYPTVCRQAAYILGNQAAAEDVAQETFLKLFQTPPREQSNLGGWLARVATNLAYNQLRSDKSRKQREIKSHPEEVAMAPAEEIALRNEEIRLVQGALDGLQERDRTCLLLRYSGMSYADIAGVLGIKPGSVGTTLARAQAKFKDEYLRLKGRGE